MLDGLYPGIRFRFADEHGNIWRQTAIFVGETMVSALDTSVLGHERVQIVRALNDGWHGGTDSGIPNHSDFRKPDYETH